MKPTTIALLLLPVLAACGGTIESDPAPVPVLVAPRDAGEDADADEGGCFLLPPVDPHPPLNCDVYCCTPANDAGTQQ